MRLSTIVVILAVLISKNIVLQHYFLPAFISTNTIHAKWYSSYYNISFSMPCFQNILCLGISFWTDLRDDGNSSDALTATGLEICKRTKNRKNILRYVKCKQNQYLCNNRNAYMFLTRIKYIHFRKFWTLTILFGKFRINIQLHFQIREKYIKPILTESLWFFLIKVTRSSIITNVRRYFRAWIRWSTLKKIFGLYVFRAGLTIRHGKYVRRVPSNGSIRPARRPVIASYQGPYENYSVPPLNKNLEYLIKYLKIF